MKPIEKLGLLFLMMFYGTNFPDSWKGAENILFIVGWLLFVFGDRMRHD